MSIQSDLSTSIQLHSIKPSGLLPTPSSTDRRLIIRTADWRACLFGDCTFPAAFGRPLLVLSGLSAFLAAGLSRLILRARVWLMTALGGRWSFWPLL